MTENTKRELLELTRRLLDAIGCGDWETYQKLCAPDLTCFEPEARNQLVEGLEFHRFYFELGGHLGKHVNTLCTPHVRMLGEDAALIAYVRLVQVTDAAGVPSTSRFEETRIWERKDGEWLHVHFHRAVGT